MGLPGEALLERCKDNQLGIQCADSRIVSVSLTNEVNELAFLQAVAMYLGIVTIAGSTNLGLRAVQTWAK